MLCICISSCRCALLTHIPLSGNSIVLSQSSHQTRRTLFSSHLLYALCSFQFLQLLLSVRFLLLGSGDVHVFYAALHALLLAPLRASRGGIGAGQSRAPATTRVFLSDQYTADPVAGREWPQFPRRHQQQRRHSIPPISTGGSATAHGSIDKFCEYERSNVARQQHRGFVSRGWR